jgi:hypothetical protein
MDGVALTRETLGQRPVLRHDPGVPRSAFRATPSNEENKLDAVIKLPSGVFRPYAGVSTAILVFTRTGVGGTEHVWP